MKDFIVRREDPILITGASGFIGSRLVEALLDLGFSNLRCLVRPSSQLERLQALGNGHGCGTRIVLVKGNLLSREDCIAATKDATVIFRLARSRGEKSFPDAFMNSVVTTRNLLEASLRHKCLKRLSTSGRSPCMPNTEKLGDGCWMSLARLKRAPSSGGSVLLGNSQTRRNRQAVRPNVRDPVRHHRARIRIMDAIFVQFDEQWPQDEEHQRVQTAPIK